MMFQKNHIRRLCGSYANRWVYRLWAVVMLFLPVGGAVFAERPATNFKTTSMIAIHPSVTITRDRIYLSDLIQAFPDTEFQEKAKQRVLMDAPTPGNQKVLPGEWVASVIRSKGWIPDAATLSVPDQVRIQRAHQTPPLDYLEDFIHDYVEERTGGADFKITRFKVRGTDKFPVGQMDFHVLEPEPTDLEGRVNLRLMVTVDGEKFGWLKLSGWVDRYEPVVCADHDLSRGTILAPSDLKLERMNVSRMPSGILKDTDLAVGKRLKLNIRADDYLRQNMLSIPPLIQKGDKVKLVATNGVLTVVTMGIAKSTGGAGDQVDVENITSKKTVVGRVKDASTIDVLF